MTSRLDEDLLGPSREDEILNERPTDRYLTGILSPVGEEVAAEEDDTLGAGGDADDEVSDDSPAPLTGSFRPSTCGVSFALERQDAMTVQFEVRCAQYEEIVPQEKTQRSLWKRRPLRAELVLNLSPREQSQSVTLEHHGIKGLELYVRTAPTPQSVIVTAALINRLDKGEGRSETEANTFLQVKLRVTPQTPARLAERPTRSLGDDFDSRVSALIYRDVQEFAVGHTCSAGWAPETQPTTVFTEWIPTAKVRRVKAEGDPAFDPLREGPARPLEAEWLAEASDSELIRGLEFLPDCYESWLKTQEARVTGLRPDLRPTASENLARCREAASRIRGSIDLLRQDASARKAWRLAAHAMKVQFAWTKKGAALRWHPFQLAFQLLVLRSLAERSNSERQIMDLLWFPTGGGKTEAYLALTAFALFYRRLKFGKAGAGTAVLMRYTLRLLTIQQFQRAAALTLACEAIRRGLERINGQPTPPLGDDAFSIGLWVGGAATPNTFDDARTALEQGSTSSPCQLQQCPRCCERLHWNANRRRKAIEVTCSNPECHFGQKHGGAPIWTVDSDVYREQPGLVIATVDKFAQIVRKDATASLFGLQSPFDPPDMIIQDELHLIAGPLGSLTGLYEIAVDRLCSRQRDGKLVRPKVIGSTATIRRAQDQVSQLFDRDAFQFPPPVIDATNSGFGLEDVNDPGRLYVGITTAGRSAKYALQATYASLLQSATDQRIPAGTDPDPRDAYWTLTGYFNSLRELGGAVTLVMDDVSRSARVYARRHGESTHRTIRPPLELTSRVASSEIPQTLAMLEQGQSNDAVDVLLASNMISVGVDIRRLGLMVVAAQPKTIAEYIQATSRVGRHYAGLVVVVYNHPRVRDRSHFESFPTWHRALYRAVEATSVTPFASRARDKALHAIVVALARHLVSGLTSTPALTQQLRDQVLPLLDSIVARAERADIQESAGTRQRARAFLEAWLQRVQQVNEYWNEQQHRQSLLIGAELAAALDESGDHYDAEPTPNSMREVEPSSLFKLYFPPRLDQGGSRRKGKV